MRTKNAILNATANVLGQILILVLNFLLRKIFLYILDANYLGISGLFSSVITMLSLAELGIGTTITFSLYRPLLVKDNRIIAALMHLYKKIYQIIGLLVLFIGITITPLVMFLTEVQIEIPHLELIYILFVVDSSISYFFSYNRTLIVADQKEYQLVVIDCLSKAILIILQASVLVLTHNYILYLITQIAVTASQNFIVYKKVQNLYPVLRTDKICTLPKEILDDIKRNTLAMIIYKLAVVIVSGTDNLIISKMLGTIWVGLYSNYSMIVLSLKSICSKMISSVTASIGNVVASEDQEKSYLVYETMQYVCFILYGICTIIMLVTINPFIQFFFGNKYLLENTTVIVILINFYLLGMQGASSAVRDAQGIFWEGKFRPLAQGLLNLILSIILVYYMNNLTAVFLGTIISRVLTVTWFDPYAVHKYGFHNTKKLKNYILKYIRYFLLLLITGGVTFKIANLYSKNTFLCLIYKGSIALCISCVIFIAASYKTTEFVFLKTCLTKVLHNKKYI